MAHNRGMTSTSGGPTQTSGGAAQRQHILDTALSLMAQRGVDGTSMRDLATAAGLNVASIYHYFPSKRDLLVSVLAERGLIDGLSASVPPPYDDTVTAVPADANPAGILTGLMDDMLQSMLEVEDFVRLMLGEVMRGDDTAHTVGNELLDTTQESLERWLADTQPDLCRRAGAAATARVLRAVLIGTFFEHVAGVLDDKGDPSAAFLRRAEETTAVLDPGT